MDPGDAPQRVECVLNSAAGEPRAVPVRQEEGSLVLRKPAVPPQRPVVRQHRCKLRSDRDQTALVELRGAYSQNTFRQIDVRQCETGRFAEAQPGSVQQEEQSPECHRVELNRTAPAALHGRGVKKPP